MLDSNPNVITNEEPARYLKIGKSILYKMAREGKIFTVKIEG